MKKFRSLIIGVVVLALLIGAYFLVTELTREEPVVTPEAEEIVVADDSVTDEVVLIAYSNDLGDVNFSKSTGAWTYPADPTMPVSQSYVDTMAESLIKVTALRDITGQGDESAYGFDEPTLELTVGTRGGKTRIYIVGAFNDVSEGYYLKFEDKVYVIDSTIVDACSHNLFEAIPVGSLEAIEADSIISLTVNGEEVPNKAGYPNIGISSVENYKDKENYGFDGSENKVTVTYNADSDVTDENGNVTSSVTTQRSYSFSYAEKDGLTYVMLPDDVCIYNATGTTALFTEPAEDTTAA